MTDVNQNAMVPAEAEEAYPVEYVDGQVYDEREEQRKDKIVDSIHKVAETVKTEAAIAKKEADTSAHATKTHIDSENAYIASRAMSRQYAACTTKRKISFRCRTNRRMRTIGKTDEDNGQVRF